MEVWQIMHPESGFRIATNWSEKRKMTMTLFFWNDVIVNFFWHCLVPLVRFGYWSKCHVNIINGSGIMAISFIMDWTEILKSQIPPSEFFPISGDWVELRQQNLARMFLIKCYWMLQNARVTAFTVSELLMENRLWWVKLPLLTHPD